MTRTAIPAATRAAIPAATRAAIPAATRRALGLLVVAAGLCATEPARAEIGSLLMLDPCPDLKPCLAADVRQMERDAAACHADAQSMSALTATTRQCGRAVEEAEQVLERIRVLRWNTTIDPDAGRALELVAESALATQQFARTEYGRRQSQLPRLPIGGSSWAVTTHIFGSLVRALPHPGPGENAVSFFKDVGGGIKLRYDMVRANTRSEIFGIELGLMIDETILQNGATGTGSAGYSVAPVLMISTFEYLYGGVGIRTIGAPVAGFENRLLFVIGFGLDGKSLTN
jgi:hypothetical protein